MHALKVAGLLALVLVTMRGGSWLLQWLVIKLRATPGRASSVVVGNLAALALFSAYVWWNLMPGEPMDLDAVLFGLVVFALFGVADWFWSPLKRMR